MHGLDRMITYQNFGMGDRTYANMIRTMLSTLEQVGTSTMFEVADMCYTSTTSVGRMCKYLGYKGYMDFRNALAEIYNNFRYHNYILPDIKTEEVNEAKEPCSDAAKREIEWIESIDSQKIDKNLELLHETQNVYYFDYMSFSDRLSSLEMNLAYEKKQVYYYSDAKGYDQALKNMKPDDVAVIMIPNIYLATYMWSYYKKCIQAGAKVILIIQDGKAPKHETPYISIEFPGYGTAMDLVCSDMLWKLVSYLYKNRYLNEV